MYVRGGEEEKELWPEAPIVVVAQAKEAGVAETSIRNRSHRIARAPYCAVRVSERDRIREGEITDDVMQAASASVACMRVGSLEKRQVAAKKKKKDLMLK